MKALSNTVLSCIHQGDQGLVVINVKSILAGVAMVLHSNGNSEPAVRYFVVERMGLDIACMDGIHESIGDE